LEPVVLMVTVPGSEGVKSYQTVRPIPTPQLDPGSPVSVVATIVLLSSVNGSGVVVMESAKSSFPGGVADSISS
jgi:hypothetical protein